MTCASCGKQIAAGVRYCIHCGAEQSPPTPIAAVAAALMARASEREAANAAHAEVASGAPGGPDPPRSHDAASPATSARREAVAANAEPPRPVYANGPGRRGLAVALIACCAIAAIGLAAVVIWRIEGEPRATSVFETAGEPAPDSTRSAPSASSAAEAPVPGEASTIAATAPAGPGAASAPPEAPAAAASAETPPGANAPVEIKALPPRPGAPRAPRPAKSAPGATVPATPAASEPTQAAPTAPPAKPRVAAATPSASHVADRWQRLDEELSRCTRQDFIARVICGQRVRFRYCDGYWGKVPACPGSPASERGQ